MSGRFGQLAWPSDVPDIHSGVLQLMLSLSQQPLRTDYTPFDAAAALGEDGMDDNDDEDDGDNSGDQSMMDALRGGAACTRGGEGDGDSDSTLSDW
jgi:hypothetical protein